MLTLTSVVGHHQMTTMTVGIGLSNLQLFEHSDYQYIAVGFRRCDAVLNNRNNTTKEIDLFVGN